MPSEYFLTINSSCKTFFQCRLSVSFADNMPASSNLEFNLRERVKELKCLYELSRIAWEKGNDLDMVLTRTAKILPAAMQHTLWAEAKITVDKKEYATEKFKQVKHKIQAPLMIDKKKRGVVEVGYLSSKSISAQTPFLTEEKELLNTVSRELSLIIQRILTQEEKEKLHLKLQHVERLAFVGELSAGIAHELNEPLGRILGFAQLIKKEGMVSEQQNEDVERIIKASLYAREVIKKLMLFSRQMPRQITDVHLNEIVSNILYFIDVRYQSSNIDMKRKLLANIPPIEADAVQMSQVLVNLITNAVHAMPQGGELTVATYRKSNYVALSVKDTGVGMPAAIKKKIFEPFFTTKPIGQGTGLGLSVVHGIVTAHGGKISVHSVLNKGSKFEILLPLRQSKGKER